MFLFFNLNLKPVNSSSGVSLMHLPLLRTVGHATGKAQCLNQLFILAGSYWIWAGLDTFWVVFLASGLCPVHEVTVFVDS